MTAICITECWDPKSYQYLGRIFHNGEKPLEVPKKQELMRERFWDLNDEKRFEILGRMLKMTELQLLAYPGDEKETHIYYQSSPFISKDPVFAFVLLPLHQAKSIIEKPPYYLFESSTFQVGDSITESNAFWARRVFPDIQLPRFHEQHFIPDSQ